MKKASLAETSAISPAMNGAALRESLIQPATPLTYGQQLAANLNTAANNVETSGQPHAGEVANILRNLASDEMLEVLEPGDGAQSYLIEQADKGLSITLLRPVVNFEIKRARDSALAALNANSAEAYTSEM